MDAKEKTASDLEIDMESGLKGNFEVVACDNKSEVADEKTTLEKNWIDIGWMDEWMLNGWVGKE